MGGQVMSVETAVEQFADTGGGVANLCAVELVNESAEKSRRDVAIDEG